MSFTSNVASKLQDADDRLAALYADSDVVWGVAAIGRLIGLNRRQAYHFISTGRLKSVRKLGGRYFASKRELLDELFTPGEDGDAV